MFEEFLCHFPPLVDERLMNRQQSNWQWNIRHPRYVAASESDCSLTISKVDADESSAVSTRLIDISRTGLQVTSQNEYPKGQLIEFSVSVDGLSFSKKCVVQWSRWQETLKEFYVGAQFESDLTYEELGELFLSNVINQEV